MNCKDKNTVPLIANPTPQSYDFENNKLGGGGVYRAMKSIIWVYSVIFKIFEFSTT